MKEVISPPLPNYLPSLTGWTYNPSLWLIGTLLPVLNDYIGMLVIAPNYLQLGPAMVLRNPRMQSLILVLSISQGTLYPHMGYKVVLSVHIHFFGHFGIMSRIARTQEGGQILQIILGLNRVVLVDHWVGNLSHVAAVVVGLHDVLHFFARAVYSGFDQHRATGEVLSSQAVRLLLLFLDERQLAAVVYFVVKGVEEDLVRKIFVLVLF